MTDERPHPHIYLAFGYFPLPVVAAGGSGVESDIDQRSGQVAFASWLYHVGDLAVKVMYARPRERCEGLKTAWHPRIGAKRLGFCRFGD